MDVCGWYWSVWISGPGLCEHMKLQLAFRANVDEALRTEEDITQFRHSVFRTELKHPVLITANALHIKIKF